MSFAMKYNLLIIRYAKSCVLCPYTCVLLFKQQQSIAISAGK